MFGLLLEILQNINSFQLCRIQDSYQSYKTPTTILTEAGPTGKFLTFGYEAERKYREEISEGNSTEINLYTDFKMILYREKVGFD